MLRITSIGGILFDIYEDKKNNWGAPFNFIYHVINFTGQGNFITRIGSNELGRELKRFLDNKNIKGQIRKIIYILPVLQKQIWMNQLSFPNGKFPKMLLLILSGSTMKRKI